MLSVTLWLLGVVATVAPPADVSGPATRPLDEKARAAQGQTDRVRLSLPTEDDLVAWQRSGMRLQLGYATGRFHGVDSSPSWSTSGISLRPGMRLGPRWGVFVAMVYAGAPQGLRWSVTLEPTLFVWRQLALSAGIGYAGLMMHNPMSAGGEHANEKVGRALGSGERLDSCDGEALTTVARLEYLFVMGPLAATGPFVTAQAQWTRCEQRLGDGNDPHSGRPAVLTQTWRNWGISYGWGVTWR